MPIKQIQLRGISRTPSDRASADGGCAESLNVHLDQSETAPTMPADESITDEIYGEAVNKYPIFFIHKMRGVVNYIGHDNRSGSYIWAYGESLGVGTSHVGVDYMDNVLVQREEIQYATSVGNTLIIFTESRPYYFLFKENKYVFLGNSVPRPMIEVASYQRDYTNNNRAGALVIDEAENNPLTNTTSAATWNAAVEGDDPHHAGLLATMSAIWGEISRKQEYFRSRGSFYAPFFVRTALRLYDGSYIHSSTPILCGGYNSDDWIEIGVFQSAPPNGPTSIYAFFRTTFDVYLHGLSKLSYGNWGDIVKSIDIFASTPIYTPAFNAGYEWMESGQYWITLDGMGSDSREKTTREEVLSKGQFYKVMSIDINDLGVMSRAANGTLKLENSETVSGELLLEQDKMPETYRDGVQYVPSNGSQNYNNRLLLTGAKEFLSRGDMFLNGQNCTGSENYTPSAHHYILRFKIVDSTTGESHYVLANYYQNFSNEYIYPSCFELNTLRLYFGDNVPVSADYGPCRPYAWIAYPDTRCKEVDVFYSQNNYGIRIPLEAHPFLECACAFFGFGNTLGNSGSIYEHITNESTFTESREINAFNKILLSEFENPFLFPAGNIISFRDNLIGAAVTSVPLSEGQMGAFDLYVFTEGGIRVLAANNMGTFSANSANPNLSRHIALPGTILSIEQAVIFITQRGVMLLSGSTVTELSSNMNGKPYVLDSSIATMLDNTDWEDILGATTVAVGETPETLMGFMSTAKVAYDSNGARLIFFNPDKAYQYVYMLETETWHKIYSGIIDPTILNSYPNCLVAYSVDQSTNKVADFTTFLSDGDLLEDDEPIAGLIVTRPFDLGEPDVRKAIRDVRIRGNFKRKGVQYILQGSFDGIHWKRLTSLRGGSYKLFRMILLCNLLPTERISWIDIDYESRYQTRLR